MVRFDASFFLFLALLLLTLPLPWLAAAIIAAVFHELCHLSALYLTGAAIQEIHIRPGGAIIRTQTSTLPQELLCAAAGPAGSLLLLSLCHCFPKTALCAGVQGIFNLLPILPMDGGRISMCLYSILFPDKAQLLQKRTETAVLLCLFVLLFFISVLFRTVIPVITAVLFFHKRKIPCKQSQIRVQ